ncbi:hypothetical protein GW755_03295 [bacterium]|nr:hypothetical protein [bacterium]
MVTIKMMENSKTFVFFSNPFGFGTVGTMLAVLEEFLENGEKRIIYVADETTLEPFGSNRGVKIIRSDQRDLDKIKEILKNIKNPVVISSQNRFALKAAKDLQIPNAFIDTLTWFWEAIPEWYYDADLYFTHNMPKTKSKIKILKKAYVVPGIFGEGLPSVSKKSDLVMYVGGSVNPLVKGIPKDYLSLLCLALDRLGSCGERITVFSDKASVKFMGKTIKNPLVRIENLPRKEFLDRVNKSKSFCATGGLTATMESFKLGTYVSFLPSTNLSQLGLKDLLVNRGVIKNSFERDEVSSKFSIPKKISEKEAISRFREMDREILQNDQYRKSFVEKLEDLIKNSFKIDSNVLNSQTDFITRVGTSGAKEIYGILKKEWGF